MSNNKDTLGDRIKRYESVSKPLLTRRTPVFVRVDGKAFHTFTQGCKKPYDQDIIDCMVYATEQTARQMQGFELAYTQSDEATFMLWDFRELETQPWFGYELNKIVSITASMFTAHFNKKWLDVFHNKYVFTPDDEHNKNLARRIAYFDARAFNVPYEDWPNVFIWRQRDWERNSIQMLARSLYSQAKLHSKSVDELKQLCRLQGKDWDKQPNQHKYGTFISESEQIISPRMSYQDYKNMEEHTKNVRSSR